MPSFPTQVALEGEISEESIRHSLRRGVRQAGDLIPWTISQQFQDDDFGKLSGARIVRIATHPGDEPCTSGYKTKTAATWQHMQTNRTQHWLNNYVSCSSCG